MSRHSRRSAGGWLWASDVALRAATEGAKISGGFGYITETAVARAFCDAKVLLIGEGSKRSRGW